MKRKAHIRRLLFCLLPSALCLALAGGIGCTQNAAATTQPTTRPLSARDRQDAAMRDPFGYSANGAPADVSGGGLTDFDRDGFNRDFKNVLDP